MNFLHKPIPKYSPVFYKTAFSICIPVVISNILAIGLNMIDTIMIGSLGVLELSGVGAANRISFICTIICFGYYGGVSVFVSQYWGIKDIRNIHKVLGIEYIFGLAIALTFMLLSMLIPYQLMGLFSKDPTVIGFGARYLVIVQFSYIFSAVTFLISFNSRCINRLLIPTAINAFALLFNTFFNYLLIFGKLGFPAWGVEGAAIATLAARIIESALMLLYVYKSKDHPLAAKIRNMFPLEITFVKHIFKTALPALVNEAAWSIGTSIYFIAFGRVNSSAIAVVQVAGVVNDLFVSVFFGLGNASAVIIGNEIGRKNIDLAYNYGKSFIKAELIFSVLSTIAIIYSREWIINIYNFDAITNHMLSTTLLIYGLFVTPRMMGYAISIGVLRAGGDTKFCMFCDIIGIWCVGIPLSFFGAITLGLPLHWVVVMCFGEEAIKIFFFYYRFISKRWINVLIQAPA